MTDLCYFDFPSNKLWSIKFKVCLYYFLVDDDDKTGQRRKSATITKEKRPR
jgi:hypothetical protein